MDLPASRASKAELKIYSMQAKTERDAQLRRPRRTLGKSNGIVKTKRESL